MSLTAPEPTLETMQVASVRKLSTIIVYTAMVLAGGCSWYIRQSAVDAIARQDQPPNAAVLDKLESSRNPSGEGVVVFVRSGWGCAPRYAWIG
jgi:hypothetical protein